MTYRGYETCMWVSAGSWTTKMKENWLVKVAKSSVMLQRSKRRHPQLTLENVRSTKVESDSNGSFTDGSYVVQKKDMTSLTD